MQHRRLQVPRRDDSARSASTQGSLCLLLRTDQPENAVCLLNVLKGLWFSILSVFLTTNSRGGFSTLKFARQYSRNDTITFNWLCSQVGWPFSIPKTIIDLVHLEAVFDVLDLYLWFSYRFMDIFPEANLVRDIQQELDEIIQQGVFQITKLLQNSETAISSNRPDEDSFSISQRKVNVFKGERESRWRR